VRLAEHARVPQYQREGLEFEEFVALRANNQVPRARCWVVCRAVVTLLSLHATL
jgi:hypothetical protein